MALVSSPLPFTTVQLGSGTLLYYGAIGKFATTRRRYPMRITRIGLPTWLVESLETTALETRGPQNDTQFGGRTYIPGEVEDPGQITLDGFLNVDVQLKRGPYFYQIVFPRKKDFAKAAKMQGAGFVISQTNNEAAINTPMPTQVVIKMSGFVTRIPALKVA